MGVKNLKGKTGPKVGVSALAPEKLIEELRTYQIELEMQNESLLLARETAQQQQTKYKNLYEFAPIGYLTLGKKEEIVEANHTAANLLGLEKSQILQRQFTDFVDPESQDTLYFFLARLRKSDASDSCELKLLKRAETPFFAHIESMMSCENENNCDEIRISFSDIHKSKMNAIALKESADRNEMLLNLLPQPAILVDKDRKVIAANQMAKKNGFAVGKLCRTKPKKRKKVVSGSQKDFSNICCQVDYIPSLQRLSTVIEDSNDAVSLIDLHGNIKAWNRMAEEMYGYLAADAMQMSIFDLVPASLKKQTSRLLKDVGAGVLIRPFETQRIARDGTVLDIRIKVTRMIEDGKIIAIAATERDLTTHNRLFASFKDLPRRIIMAQENEKSRISQILHSEFGQALIALKLFTVISSSNLDKKNDLMRTVLDKIRNNLDTIINDTRNLAHELSPPGLKYAGLVPAIKGLIDSATSKEKLQIRFFHRNMGQACFKEKDIIIYRILQEAIQNILKHSQATRARVSAVLSKTNFVLEISDNGKGFDSTAKSSSPGLGLALMSQQALLIRGRLSIESHAGKGTLLKITVPIKEKK